jgi:hypothetical protein
LQHFWGKKKAPLSKSDFREGNAVFSSKTAVCTSPFQGNALTRTTTRSSSSQLQEFGEKGTEWIFLFLSVETEGRETTTTTTTAAAAAEERKFAYPISQWIWYTLGTPSVGPLTSDKAFDPAPKISQNQVKPTIDFRNAHTRCSS